MVPLEQEDQSQEEEDIPLLEGFQWESLMDASNLGPSRKRSLSESSLAPPSAHSLLVPQTPEQAAPKGEECLEEPGVPAPEKMGELEQGLADREEKFTLQRCDSVLEDSSSGPEVVDGQGTGKRRRAAGVSRGSSATSCCIKTKLTFFS